MTRERHRFLGAVGVALLLAGCGLLVSPPSQGTLHEQGTTEVEIGVGETTQVSLGDGSPGIGDDWGVISQTDDSVVDAEVVLGENVYGATGVEDAPGSSTPFAVELTGLASGSTQVRVLYCTRTEIADDCDQSIGTLDPPVDPVEIVVTVR